jgi:hypothetical protein
VSCKLKRFMRLLVFSLLILFKLPQAHADTYHIYEFTDYGGAGPVLNLDDHGRVLFRAPCADGSSGCYSIFDPGYESVTTYNYIPPYSYAGGAVFDLSGITPISLTDGNYELDFEGSNRLLYGGPKDDLQLISSGVVADFIAINDYGDIAWTNGSREMNFLAYDITAHWTPEPNTLALLLTGLIPIAAITRRKLTRHNP